MLSSLWDFLVATIKDVLLSVVLLVLGLAFTPDPILFWVLKKIRPDLTSRRRLIEKIKTMLDYILNVKNVKITSDETSILRQAHENTVLEPGRTGETITAIDASGAFWD